MRHLVLVPLLLVVVGGCGHGSNDRGAQMGPDRTGWRKLSKGMTAGQVRAIFGEPRHLATQGRVTCWYYQEGQPLERNATNGSQWVIPRGALLFSAQGAGGMRLAEWREP
jgi:hypothetical protein